MKLRILLPALCLAAQMLVAAEPAKTVEPRSPRILLQEALFAEEAERDFEKASAGYKEMLEQFATQRALAATALYHLAEIRAKQKQTAEAIALHQRLLAEFPKEEALGKLSRDRLAQLGAAVPAVVAGGADALSPQEAEELARIQKIVKNSPDLLEAPDENGHPPLIKAGLAGWIQVSTLLLDNGVNIDGKGGPWVPLGAAARGGHKRLVELLLARGADVNATARGGGWTALHSASNHNRVEVARLLLERGANPNLVAPDHPRFEGAEATPLLLAIAKQEKEMVALLLEKGADANLADPETHRAPLIAAVGQDQKALIELLLEHKAQVDQPGARGETPLIDAAIYNRLEAAKTLVAHQARVDLEDEIGATALHYAAETSEPMVAVLLAAGASPKAVTKAGQTPLHFTALVHSSLGQAGARMTRLFIDGYQRGRLPIESVPKVWEELLAKGADVNATDEQGCTVLHYACSISQLPLVDIELLLKKGADPEVKAKDGIAPFVRSQYQDKLERQYLYPRFAKQHAITLVDRSTTGYVHPLKMEPANEQAEPPTWEAVFAKLGLGARSIQPAPTRITIYRADGEGQVKEAGSFQVQAEQGKAVDLPPLQWGDVVVCAGPSLAIPGVLNPARRVRVINGSQ